MKNFLSYWSTHHANHIFLNNLLQFYSYYFFFLNINNTFSSYSRYHHTFLQQCVTKEECATAVKGEWFITNGTCRNDCPPFYERKSAAEGYCVYCGIECTKVCGNGNETYFVENLDSIMEFKECTHINGSLFIRQIKHKDLLKEFKESFQYVLEITGFFKIERSDSITSLQDILPRLRIIGGNYLEKDGYALYVFENVNLEKLWNWTNPKEVLKIKKGKFSFHGNPKLCLDDIDEFSRAVGVKYDKTLDISRYKEICTFIDLNPVVVENNPTNVTLKWNKFEVVQNDTFRGYLVVYATTEQINKTQDNDDTCDVVQWETIFLKETSVQIVDLQPFTEYTYFIETFSNVTRQTKYEKFTTLSSDPTPPINVAAISNTSNSILLTWNPPTTKNGILSHYTLAIYEERDDRMFLQQINYCNHSRFIKPTKIVTPKVQSNLPCTEFCKRKEMIEKMDNIFSDVCKHTFISFEDISKYEGSCKSFMYHDVEEVNSPSLHQRPIEIIEIPANRTSYLKTNLAPYTMYIIYLRACNENRTEEIQCSDPVMLWQRTTKDSISGDKIDYLDVHTKDNNVILRWHEPKQPNGLIVAYEIEHKRSGVEYSKSVTECILYEEFQKQNNEYEYELQNFLAGKYRIRVRAVSIAGPGSFTDLHDFTIVEESQNLETLAILLTLLFLFLLTAAAAFVYLYKRKRHLESLHLIRDINPDYAGPMYVEDDWEVERKNVEILHELGKGEFGKVYSGILKPAGIECAVKTCNEGASPYQKMEFLNEASVMKSFKDAHHVVKLLGVVSRGDSPLVIMELMARGDLKSFLRASRESSHNITCNEMYRMAAEIADGMAYLAAKKFIHRDLAARNCMVAADHTVKIGDFGMARDIYENDYYRKESRGLLPVRWMAPESLADGVFTSDSDVWSYGIVLWEMVTLAEQPYQGLSNEQVLQFVVSRGTLIRPDECPDLLWEIMESCWKWRPNNRPLFIHIVEKLEGHVGPDFKLVSYYRSRSSEEHRMMAKERTYNPPAMSMPTQDREPVVHWNQSDDEETSLYGESSRPKTFLSFPYQRHRPPSSNFLDDQIDDDISTT